MLPMTIKNMIIHDFSLTRDCRTFPPGDAAESLNFTVGHPRLYLPPEGAACGEARSNCHSAEKRLSVSFLFLLSKKQIL